MDAFYASIEQRDRPHLRGRPVVVGGNPDTRGVVAASSYEARRYGIKSAMPTRTAVRLCAHVAIIPPDFPRYRRVSRQLHAVLSDYSSVIEPLSLDEAYLDVTDDPAGLGSATLTAREIRRRVAEELGLTCSVGVAPVKFVAKIASDHRKPDGLTVIKPHQVLPFIRPLPLTALWGVGPATLARLKDLDIETIGELADLDEAALVEHLGSRGRMLWRMAHGLDDRRVSADRVRKSRSAERTFDTDVTDRDRIMEALTGQSDQICRGLRDAQDLGRTVTLKVRFADFSTVTRSHTLPKPTDDAAVVLATAVELLERANPDAQAVRLIGVGLSNLLSEGEHASAQLVLPWPTR